MKKYKLLGLIIVAMLVSLALYLVDYHRASNIILAVVVIIAVIPLLWGMLTTLKSGRYGIDILAAAAMITSV
ncbi:MAG TPA: hypothetical protein VMQ58_00565, partial [Candidatus Saccharimonadales bacterium]|nr:hypothetical protein [Candidatus Saccharimonadales bacterium]